MRPETVLSPLQFSDNDQKHQGYNFGENKINVSSLNHFSSPVQGEGFAIKFVQEGTERYSIHDNSFDVSAGHYLLLNGEKSGTVEIDGSANTKGICITVSSSMVEEVVSFKRMPEGPFSNPSLSGFLYTSDFLDNCYDLNNQTGKILQSLSQRVVSESMTKDDLSEEFFLGLAEAIVEDQVKVYRQLQNIPVLRSSAKKDLFRRVQKGKELIDECFCTQINTEQIAQHATLSQFHFFRLFKSIYQLSPYQYILNKRLDLAKSLLLESETVSNTALETGFSDVHSFSKAFKKKFGISPRQFSTDQK